MDLEKDTILKLILGLDSANDRLSTLQLAIKQARRLIGITHKEEASYTLFQHRKSKDANSQDALADTILEAFSNEEMDILTSLSLYLIVLDQLGHIFGSRSKKGNRVKEALENSNINTGLKDIELEEIAGLRNSINHNFGLACYNPDRNLGVKKYTICLVEDGKQKPIVDAIKKWEGDWCCKNEDTSVHVHPFSLINLIEKVIDSYIKQYNDEKLYTPLCVEELKTRFTIVRDVS